VYQNQAGTARSAVAWRLELLSHHFSEVAEAASELAPLCRDVLGPASAAVAHVQRQPCVGQVDETGRQLLETVASAEVQQSGALVRRRTSCQ